MRRKAEELQALRMVLLPQRVPDRAPSSHSGAAPVRPGRAALDVDGLVRGPEQDITAEHGEARGPCTHRAPRPSRRRSAPPHAEMGVRAPDAGHQAPWTGRQATAPLHEP